MKSTTTDPPRMFVVPPVEPRPQTKPFPYFQVEGSLWIATDFDLGLIASLEAGAFNFTTIHKSFGDSNLPPAPTGRQDIQTFFRKPELSEGVTGQQWLASLQASESCIHPKTLFVLRDRKKDPLNRHWTDLIMTVWTDPRGQMWYAVLNEDERQRNLAIQPVDPQTKFGNRYRLAFCHNGSAFTQTDC